MRSIRLRLAAIIVLLSWVSVSTSDDDFGGHFGGDMGGLHLTADLSREVHFLRRPHSEPSPARQSKETKSLEVPKTTIAHPEIEQVHKQLRQKSDFDLIEEPLSTAMELFKGELGVNLIISRPALEDVAIDENDPVSLEAKNMSYAAALYHLLRPLELTYVVDRNLIRITSNEKAEEAISTRVYPVADLAIADRGELDIDSLIECIVGTIAPNSWDEVGGPGLIAEFRGSLSIAQTDEIHREVSALLQTLRRFPRFGHPTANPKSAPRVADLDNNEMRLTIAGLFETKLSLSVDDEPLVNVLEMLQEETGANLIIDVPGVEDEGVDPTSEPVTIELENIQANAAMALFLDELGLAFTASNEAVVITSKSIAEETLHTRVYSCADLVSSDDLPHAASQLGELSDLISGCVNPNSWEEVGGPGSIRSLANQRVLIVSNTPEVHTQIETQLAMLRQSQSTSISLDHDLPTDQIVRSYALTREFRDPDASTQLVETIEKMLIQSDNAVNGSNQHFYVKVVGGNLVISHRRDAHRALSSILVKLNALEPNIQHGFGTMMPPPSGMF